jgi:RNA polymerase-binding transcription factor DksA
MTAALTMRLIARDAALLGEVDQALARVAAGTYGRCEGSGEPIGYARLKVRPWARCSVAYAQEREELMLAGQSRRGEARRRRGASGPHAGGSVEDDREENDSAD